MAPNVLDILSNHVRCHILCLTGRPPVRQFIHPGHQETITMQAKITATQAATLIATRGYSDADRKATKRALFAAVRAQYNIPTSVKLKVEVDDTSSPDYLVLKNKHTDAIITVPDTAGTAVPVATPANANQAATQSTDTGAGTPPTPDKFRLVIVKRSDVFTSLNYGCLNDAGSDEVVVRIPA